MLPSATSPLGLASRCLLISNGLGRLLDRDTPRAARSYPVEVGTTTRALRSWNQNGAWLDQGSYGTCVGNAFAHRRADGPLLIPGIDQPFAQQLYLEASALYWGEPDTSMFKGTSGLSAAQALLNRGAIDRFEWVTTPEGLRYALLEQGSLCMGLDWYTSMDHPSFIFNPDMTKQACYLTMDQGTKRGGHEGVLNKIDLAPTDGFDPYVRFKNSWGTPWANHGTARIRLSDMDDLVSKGWVDLILIHELPRAA